MNCFRCGRENGQGSAFCSYCGAPLTSADAPQQAANKKRARLIIGIAAGVVALAGMLAAANFLFLAGPGVKGLWVCRERGWALRIEDSVLTEYSPAGTDKISYTYQNGKGTAMLSSGEVSFTVSSGEMTLVDEETGEKYLFVRDDGADVEAVVAAGLRGLWSSEELGRVLDLGENGTLKLHTISDESDGSFALDPMKGRGAITLDGREYGFTAGWDIITVEGMGGFVRADVALDVAAFVREHGKSPLAGTWYDVSGQYGAITFGEDGTYRVELYGKTSTGAYTFDAVKGEGFIQPDGGDEPMGFILEDGRLVLGEAAYTRQYVEQPGAEDYYAAVAGSWVAAEDHSLVLEFAGDGTVVFHSGSGSASGTFSFNPVDRTGTIWLAETEHYPFRLAGDTLYVDNDPYVRADAVNTPEREPDSLLGLWYDEAGQAGTLYFEENGAVTMETHGVVYDGTYTFNKAAGSGKVVVKVDGEDVTISIYLLYGKLYTDDTVYTQTYVEQAQ